MSMTPTQLPLPKTNAAYGVDPNDGSPIVIACKRSSGRLSYSPATMDNLNQEGAVIATCPTARESLTRWIHSPLKQHAKAIRVLPSLLDVQLPFPLEDCQFSFAQLRSTPTGIEALAVATRNSGIADHLAELPVNPQVIDQEGLALWTQALHEATGPAIGLRIIIHLSASHLTIVLGQDDDFLSAHTLSHDNPQRIERLIRPRLTTGTPVTWVWTGAGTADPQRVSSLKQGLEEIAPGTSQAIDTPAEFLARALATRALIAGNLRTNLRGGPFIHPAMASNQTTSTAGAAILCLIAGLLMTGVSVRCDQVIDDRHSDIHDTFKTLAESVSGASIGPLKGSTAMNFVTTEFEARSTAAPFFAHMTRAKLSRSLDELLREGKRLDVRFNRLSLDTDAIYLSGTCGDWDHVDTLAAFTRDLGWNVTFSRQELPENERITFTIQSAGSDVR